MQEHMKANRAHWDELAPIHVRSEFYDVEGFKRGGRPIRQEELDEVGDVSGKTFLHLQCHFGLDTLAWARLGARVTGVDFSEPAIEAARALAAELGIDARFVGANVYEAPSALDGQFDVVYTSRGVLCWLPDARRWAKVVAHFVAPGGFFYIREFHPFAGVFDDDPEGTDLRVRYPYFPGDEPLRFENDTSYASAEKVASRTTFEWPHPIGEVVTSLIEAGLVIDFLHESPLSEYRMLPFMAPAGNRTYRLNEGHGSVPFMYSIKAHKPR